MRKVKIDSDGALEIVGVEYNKTSIYVRCPIQSTSGSVSHCVTTCAWFKSEDRGDNPEAYCKNTYIGKLVK